MLNNYGANYSPQYISKEEYEQIINSSMERALKVKCMKKYFLAFALILMLNLSFAWDDCPYGRVNCTYPGECGRYVDTNNNNICDHSEPAPEFSVDLSTNNTVNANNIQLTEELIDEYVDISGKELKSYTIKEICDKYNINPNCLKEKLKINVPDVFVLNCQNQLHQVF